MYYNYNEASRVNSNRILSRTPNIKLFKTSIPPVSNLYALPLSTIKYVGNICKTIKPAVLLRVA